MVTMTAIEFVVLALATWRVSSLLAEEDGPGDVFARLRYWIGVRYDGDSQPYGENGFARWWLCMWCLPGLIATAWWLFWLAVPRVAYTLALPFALWAVAVFVHSRGVRARKREW